MPTGDGRKERIKDMKGKNSHDYCHDYCLTIAERYELEDVVRGTDYSGARKKTENGLTTLGFYAPCGKEAKKFISFIGGFSLMDEGKFYTIKDMGLTKNGELD